MVNLSVSVPSELKQKIDFFDEVNWSAVARKAFEKKVEELELMKKILSKSKLNKKDAKEIADKINEGMAKRIKSLKR